MPLEVGPDVLTLTPSTHGYEEARQVFNRSIDRRPQVIHRCLTTEAARKLSAQLMKDGVPFTVRGGGHSIAGNCVGDGAVMIDLSLLRRVEVDPSTRIARAEPGALMCDLDRATTAHRLAVTGGIISHTGLAGLCLGGGLGWLMGEFGLTCDNLVGVSAVDSAGDSVEVAESDADLQWFRGSGRDMGVVTELRLRLRPVPDQLTTGRWYGDALQSAPMMAEIGGRALDLPDWLTLSPVWMRDGGSTFPIIDCVSTRDPSETRSALASLNIGGRWTWARRSYVEAQAMLDSASRHGQRNYWKSLALPAVDEAVGELCQQVMELAPSPSTFISLDVIHGRALQEPLGGSTVSIRNQPFVLLFNTIWSHQSDDEANIDWARRAFAALQDATGGRSTYENYLSADDTSRRAPIPARWRRPEGHR